MNLQLEPHEYWIHYENIDLYQLIHMQAYRQSAQQKDYSIV